MSPTPHDWAPDPTSLVSLGASMEARADETDEAFLDRLADAIVRRRMSAPAIMLLESIKPLNFVGSQFMVFLDPIVKLFVNLPDYGRLTRMLEDRDTIERLLQAIERRDDADSTADGATPPSNKEYP